MENWKVISDYDFKYEVSDKGNIKFPGVPGHSKAKITAGSLNKFNGYYYITLTKNGKSVRKAVHRLVAEYFIPNSEGKPTVDHIDRDRKNNDVSNLRWATHKEQIENSDNSLRRGDFDKPVRCIETGEVYKSASHAEKVLNLRKNSVRCAANPNDKYHKRAGNFTFKYV